MSKGAKRWLIAATILCLMGILISIVLIGVIKGDFHKLQTVKYETNTYNITEEVNQIMIHGSTADLTILPSQDGECRVICYEREQLLHNVKVEEGRLTIEEVDTRDGLLSYVEGINTESIKITVYLPEVQYELMEIQLSTGDVHMENIEMNILNIRVSTGDVHLKNVIAEEFLRIKGTTGDVEMECCDSESIRVELSTGDMEATLRTPKTFQVSTGTGDVEIPRNTTGGLCEITTSTGDIEVEILP